MDTSNKKKNRGLVNRTAIGNSLDNNLHKLLMELHKETDIPISKLLDKAVTLLLKEYGKSTKWFVDFYYLNLILFFCC